MRVGLIADQHDRRIAVLKPLHAPAIVEIGTPAPVAAPGGLALDRQGNLIVTDSKFHRLAIRNLWTSTWQLLGSQGTDTLQFDRPSAVAIDALERIYVADAGNHRIIRMDDVSGKGWLPYGTAGLPTNADPQAIGMFADPRGLTIDGQGRVCVTDPAAHRAVQFDSTLTGAGWTELPIPAGPNPVLPMGIAAGPNQLAISDIGNRMVHVFDLNNTLIASLDGDTVGIAVPAYLAYDGNHLVVADIVRNELKEFLVTDATFTHERTVRGTSPDRLTILFREIGGLASGGL